MISHALEDAEAAAVGQFEKIMERLSQNDLPGGRRNGVANDLDLILSSQLDNYNHLSRDYPPTTGSSDDLNSLFFDPSSSSSSGSLDTPPSSNMSSIAE